MTNLKMRVNLNSIPSHIKVAGLYEMYLEKKHERATKTSRVLTSCGGRDPVIKNFGERYFS